jgi:hypothetical protein
MFRLIGNAPTTRFTGVEARNDLHIGKEPHRADAWRARTPLHPGVASESVKSHHPGCHGSFAIPSERRSIP